MVRHLLGRLRFEPVRAGTVTNQPRVRCLWLRTASCAVLLGRQLNRSVDERAPAEDRAVDSSVQGSENRIERAVTLRAVAIGLCDEPREVPQVDVG